MQDTYSVTSLSLKELLETRLVMIIEKRDGKNNIMNRRPYPSSECLMLILSEKHPDWRLVCETNETDFGIKTVCQLINENGDIIRQNTSCDERNEIKKYGGMAFDDKAYQVQESKTIGYVLRAAGMQRYIMKQLVEFYDKPKQYLQLSRYLPGNDYQNQLCYKQRPQPSQDQGQSQSRTKINIPDTRVEDWVYEKVGLKKTGGLEGNSLSWQHLIENYPLVVQDKEGETQRGASYLHKLAEWEKHPQLQKVAKECLEIRKSFKKSCIEAQKDKEPDNFYEWINEKTGIGVCGDLTWKDLMLNKNLPRGEPGLMFLENQAYSSIDDWDEFCVFLVSMSKKLKGENEQSSLFEKEEKKEGVLSHYEQD